MRQIVLDTETTGLEARDHRIIEIGCIEIIDRQITDNRFHHYLNPERTIEDEAIEVHGITNEMLVDKPRFADIVDSLLTYLHGAELIIHNAPFDVGFLNAELARLDGNYGRLEERCTIFDTLVMARRLHPGQKNNLDALCKRYAIDNSHRTLHGALLDAEILADLYLTMTGGQIALDLAQEGGMASDRRSDGGVQPVQRQGRLPVIRANAEEQELHQQRLAALDKAAGKPCLWRQFEA
jgi:DNA polymerase III subunit epsilon